MFKGCDCVILLVSYYSYGWTKKCLESLFYFFPEHPVLIVDNTPCITDSEYRKNSYKNRLCSKNYPLTYDKIFEVERKWFKSKKNIQVIQTPHYLFHGNAVNFALKWCYFNEIKTAVHIEPDCLVGGKNWLENLLKAIDEGYWMAGGCRLEDGVLHPTPTIWLVYKCFWLDFEPVCKNNDIFHPRYHLVCDDYKILPSNFDGWRKNNWDTGMKAWFEMAKIGKAKHVNTHDFLHIWGSSSTKNFRIGVTLL